LRDFGWRPPEGRKHAFQVFPSLSQEEAQFHNALVSLPAIPCQPDLDVRYGANLPFAILRSGRNGAFETLPKTVYCERMGTPMKPFIALTACLFAALGYFLPVGEARAQERIRIDSRSRYGVIVMELEPSQPSQQYQVNISTPYGEPRRSGPGDKSCLLNSSDAGSQFAACRLRPGRYVMWMISGSYTFLCYQRQLEFVVGAGEPSFSVVFVAPNCPIVRE
jgi:hypothetical protein